VVWFVLMFAAALVWVIPVWAMVTPPSADRDAMRRDGERVTIHAEPWFGRTAPTLVALGVAILAVVLSSVPLVVVTGIIGAANCIVSRLEHRNTVIRLDGVELEVVSPWFATTRSQRFALRDITSVEIIEHKGAAEQNHYEYVRRSVRIVIAGARHALPLPMHQESGDAFIGELRNRIAAVGSP
jgi:hypothetical protein